MNELKDFREELLESVRGRIPESMSEDQSALDFAFLTEVAFRLEESEEINDLIPVSFSSTGSRNRKIRVDGYQQDEADGFMRMFICAFEGGTTCEVMTRTKADNYFGQLRAFVEDCISGKIESMQQSLGEAAELTTLINKEHGSFTKYRFYIFTDNELSGRLRELDSSSIDGVQVDYQIWDVGRLFDLAKSRLGTEEYEIDFRDYVDGGLPCLKASSSYDHTGYLAVIPGGALASIYDKYGSRLLEGNVRAFLTTKQKVNRGIQATIAKEPAKFFIYNNGISATATGITLSPDQKRIETAKYFQIVNGGQTTASLHVASKIGGRDLTDVDVQMKLSVVNAEDSEGLDDLIENIARFSNSQNGVNDADFFANHAFHRAFESLSKKYMAPAKEGAQFGTYWFYERARGKYQSEQLALTPAQKRKFAQTSPRSQLISKLDLAKYENAWRQLPNDVSLGGQKNFKKFAALIESEWGDDGRKFNNETYFKSAIARAILFKKVEKIVTAADWYAGGGTRSFVVAHSISKLSEMIQKEKPGYDLDFEKIWRKQRISDDLEAFLGKLVKNVADILFATPKGMQVGEWAKKKDCWDRVKSLDLRLPAVVVDELSTPEEVTERKVESTTDGAIRSELEMLKIALEMQAKGCWVEMEQWANQNYPLSGKKADILRLVARKIGFIPSEKQARVLMELKEELEAEGFISLKC